MFSCEGCFPTLLHPMHACMHAWQRTPAPLAVWEDPRGQGPTSNHAHQSCLVLLPAFSLSEGLTENESVSLTLRRDCAFLVLFSRASCSAGVINLLWLRQRIILLCHQWSWIKRHGEIANSVKVIELLMMKGCFSSSPCLPASSLHTQHTHKHTQKDPFCCGTTCYSCTFTTS